MLDSIYHMALKLLWIHIFGVKTLGFCHMHDFESVISWFIDFNAWSYFIPRGDVMINGIISFQDVAVKFDAVLPYLENFS